MWYIDVHTVSKYMHVYDKYVKHVEIKSCQLHAAGSSGEGFGGGSCRAKGISMEIVGIHNYGDGSPIITIFGEQTSIYQLFWCEQKGTTWLARVADWMQNNSPVRDDLTHPWVILMIKHPWTIVGQITILNSRGWHLKIQQWLGW